MAIINHSEIITNSEVQRLLELLPVNKQTSPTIYLFDNWKPIVSAVNIKKDLYDRYAALKTIVRERIFSTYNYRYNAIFIYLFNLPYQSITQTKLHSVFCLFHEMRHFYQYQFCRERFFRTAPDRSSYSQSWVEKDATKHAVRWMRKNRDKINDILRLEHLKWDIRVNEHNKLRVITSCIQAV